MKVRIERVSISQCVKVATEIGALVVVPLAYALLSYLGGLLCAWISNLVAGRIGGFEYTTAEITTSP